MVGFFLFMDGFIELEKRFRNFDINNILKKVWEQPKVEQYIVELNTEEQLYKKGIGSDGKQLEPPYTVTTIQFKVEKGQRFDHVTLKDSGGFYESFEVIPNNKGFKIKANPITDDGTNLFAKYGDVTGLTQESTELLERFIAPYFNTETEKALSR